LIAIERPGPSHTLESLAAQRRAAPPPIAQFTDSVPAAERDVCHNMRGESIDAWTAKTHRLFEAIAAAGLPIATIGLGDGGNEIGMGQYQWEVLVDAMGSNVAGRIVSRIATDFTIIGGVSDWAAYGLALAVARLCGATGLGRRWDSRGQRELVERLVAQTRAVDGLTLRREATVDGLPLDIYLRPLEEMRKLLGYRDAGEG
jgi:hypothetical protein